MALIITAFFLQAASTPPVLVGSETWGYIYKFLALAVPLALGGLKLRDMVLENRRRIENYEKKQDDCQRKQEEKDGEIFKLIRSLEEKREKDLIESRSLEGISAIIDTKIKLEMASVMKEIFEQRRVDMMLMKDSISEIKEMLAGINSNMAQFSKEFDRLRPKSNNQ